MSITLSHITKSFGGTDILSDISFSILHGDRIALIGKNGAGKSTLLKIAAKIVSPDEGAITVSPGITVGYIPQTSTISENETVSTLLTFEMETRFADYELALALSTFSLEHTLFQPISQLSSGQRTKVYLSRLILQKPNVLLLDEPTNHLDTESLEWLESYVNEYDGALFFVSHDRMFLDNVATKIIELDNGKIQTYGGNYSFYRNEKEIARNAQLSKYVSQQKTVGRLTEELFLNRQKSRVKNIIKKKKGQARGAAGFYANRQSQIFGSISKNIERKIERMEKVDKPETIPELKALFRPNIESGELVFAIKNATKTYDGTTVLSDISLYIHKAERIALIGNNGTGKTTFIQALLGKIPLDTGEIKIGSNVTTGYLSQEHTELHGKQSVQEELMDTTKKTVTECYQLLRRFLVSPDKFNQSVDTLSSGEKAKILLAEIMASGSNCIILDEPTNHLDIPSREALETAIANYEGTLVVISHDRYFLQQIGITRAILFTNQGLFEQNINL